MNDTIPQGMVHNNTFRPFTSEYFFKTIKKMSEFDAYQLLLMKIRDDYCEKSATKLAQKIEKNESYVHRLFYPIGKKGRKGIGLEIINACKSAFPLPAGYWDGTPAPSISYKRESFPVEILQNFTTVCEWPFKDVSEWQYNKLSAPQKEDVEKYIKLQLSTKDPTLEQSAPAHVARTGTN